MENAVHFSCPIAMKPAIGDWARTPGLHRWQPPLCWDVSWQPRKPLQTCELMPATRSTGSSVSIRLICACSRARAAITRATTKRERQTRRAGFATASPRVCRTSGTSRFSRHLTVGGRIGVGAGRSNGFRMPHGSSWPWQPTPPRAERQDWRCTVHSGIGTLAIGVVLGVPRNRSRTQRSTSR